MSALFMFAANVSSAKTAKAEREPASTRSPKFSAFIVDKILYVTLLGDACNDVSGRIVVDPLCKKSRLTRNFVVFCNVELETMQTLKACTDTKAAPKVVEIRLDQTEVDPKAKLLRLKFKKDIITVGLTE